MATIITTDSAADLSQDLLGEFNIHTIPLTVTTGEKTGFDGIEMFPEDIFSAFDRDGTLPKTSAISVGAFESFFQDLTKNGDELVYIPLSSGISACYDNAVIAAKELPQVHVVDSKLCTSGEALLALHAAILRDLGHSAAEITAHCAANREKIRCYFLIDKLDFLAAGGRVSSIAKAGANLLGVHPSLLVDGTTKELLQDKKYRGKIDSVQETWLRDCCTALLGKSDKTYAVVAFSSVVSAERREHLMQIARETAPEIQRWIFLEIGCLISAHAGPNSISFAMLET